eukprot:scaffold1347_cov350-Pavlova_lutheri.AAC.18
MVRRSCDRISSSCRMMYETEEYSSSIKLVPRYLVPTCAASTKRKASTKSRMYRFPFGYILPFLHLTTSRVAKWAR